jgi:hypothetical protein
MSFEIGAVHKKRPHLFADLAELILVSTYDGTEQLSQAKLELVAKELPIADDDLDDQDSDAEHAIDIKESSDKAIEDCWAQLEYRQAVFGDFYPFEVLGAQLRWKPGSRTSRQCAYTFLLVCSRLRSFAIAGFAQRAAKVFAKVSRAALQGMAGLNAAVRIFDANSDDRREHYGLNLRDAIRKLAVEVGAHHISEADIDGLDASGDAGLDLVAVHQFDDGAVGSFAIFGQCASQETDWPSKTLEADPRRFTALFNCLHEHSNLMFIPISFRKASGEWVHNRATSGCLLVDRLRILRLLDSRWADSEALVSASCYPILRQAVDIAAAVA